MRYLESKQLPTEQQWRMLAACGIALWLMETGWLKVILCGGDEQRLPVIVF